MRKKNKNAPTRAKSTLKRNYFTFLVKRFWIWLKNLIFKMQPIFKKGTHIITGYPGSGKTLLVNKIVNIIDSKKYFFITNINEFKQENVYHFDVWDLFEDNTQVKKLPTVDAKGRKLYALILDEINLKFNRRLNRSKSYNNQFIGLVEMLVSSRHQGINRVYFIGQKLELQDAQLQSLFKYCHNIIYSKSRALYPVYLDNGNIVFAPKRLYIDNYLKNFDDIFESDKITTIDISYDDLNTYNTFGLKEEYDNLPYLQSKNGNFYKAT